MTSKLCLAMSMITYLVQNPLPLSGLTGRGGPRVRKRVVGDIKNATGYVITLLLPPGLWNAAVKATKHKSAMFILVRYTVTSAHGLAGQIVRRIVEMELKFEAGHVIILHLNTVVAHVKEMSLRCISVMSITVLVSDYFCS